MPKKVTYWECREGHRHPSRSEAELCESPLTGGETIQGGGYKIGDKFLFDSPLLCLSFHNAGRRTLGRQVPRSLPVWVITGIESVPINSRPGPGYQFERAVYTLVSSDGQVMEQPSWVLKNETKVENVRRLLLARFRSEGWDTLPPDLRNEIDEVTKALTAEAAAFNPHLA